MLSKDVDHTVAVDVAKMILDTYLTKVAIVLNAEMRSILFIVVAIASLGSAEVVIFRYLVIIISRCQRGPNDLLLVVIRLRSLSSNLLLLVLVGIKRK